jgi:predicted Ser/Thr protein kinase
MERAMGDERTTIGKYEIVSELGRGGMGVVFKAWEESLQRFVAIKMLGDQLTNDENLVARFLREARAVADLNHPNIVQVFSVDKHEGRPYFAMEFVEGESLTELIRTSNKIEPSRALTLLKEVANGMSAAHDKGVVHRDIKPDNIMLTRHGGVKVVDFGVARVEDPNTKLTATGMAVGTPNYISPEVCLGLDVDQRSDLFSMGVVLYEMLTGETPFDADSPLEMMTNVVQAEVPDVGTLCPSIDEGLRSILYHLLEKKPEYRYQDFHQVLEDIDAYKEGKPLPYAGKASSRATMKVDTSELTRATGNAGPGREQRSKPWALAAGLLLAAVVAGAAGWQFLGPGFGFGDEDAAPVLDVEESGLDSPETPVAETEDSDSGMDGDDGAMDEASSDPEPVAGGDDGMDDAATEDMPEEAVAETDDDTPTPEPDTNSDSTPSSGGTVKPPPPAPPDYSDPQLVVVVNGDPAVSGAIESTLEGALSGAGIAVLNEQFFDGYRSGLDIASLARVATNNDSNVVVVADVRSTGTRQLEYFGRQTEQTLATLQVTAMLPAEKRNLGAPWQTNLAYTGINADEQGRNAAEAIARDLVGRVNELKASQ